MIGIPSADRLHSGSARRRPWLNTVQQKFPSATIPQLLIFAFIISSVFYFYPNTYLPGSTALPYACARHAHPKVQTDARLEQDKFCCNVLESTNGQMPDYVELAWSAEHEGELASRLFQDAEYKNAVIPADSLVLQKADGIPTLVSGANYSMYVFNSRNGFQDIVSSFLEVGNPWEAGEAGAHVHYLTAMAEELNVAPSSLYFIDIGANVGAFTMGVANAGFNVIAIEAMKVNQHALRLTLCSNPAAMERVTLLPVALGKEEVQCSLFTGNNNVLDGTVRCDQGDTEKLRTSTQVLMKRQNVDIRRLDDVLADWIPSLVGRVGAVKIDTEGFEPWVFEGAEKFFTQVKPRFVQLEVSMMTKEATGVNVTELMTRLAAWGYSLRASAYATEDLQPGSGADYEEATPSNIYLVAN